MEAYLESPARPVVILRHDVDRNAANAVRMARLENVLGLRATYYVRMVSGVFVPAIVRTLHHLGHEVGYHYEVLAKAHGDMAKALDLFEEELTLLRRWAPVRTVCMHGSPLSRWDNLSIWEQSQPADFGLLGEPYLDIDYSQVAYYTDTGRTWDAARTNLRDRVGQDESSFPRVHTTDDLIALIRWAELPALCIQTHPERWNASVVGWMLSAILDWIVNGGKLVISFIKDKC
jgi:hypothetical protein